MSEQEQKIFGLGLMVFDMIENVLLASSVEGVGYAARTVTLPANKARTAKHEVTVFIVHGTELAQHIEASIAKGFDVATIPVTEGGKPS